MNSEQNTELPVFKEVAPETSRDLKQLLEAKGEKLLAAQIDHLTVIEVRADNYGSDYYTAPQPIGPYGAGHRTLSLRPGGLHVDVVGDRIVLIEVLYGPRVARQAAGQ